VGRPLGDVFGTERVIGSNDLISFETMQKAIAIGRFVGLVALREPGAPAGAPPKGIATGSMVSPRLLLTNHHVLQTPDEAAQACVVFDYQLGMDDMPVPPSTFDLMPDEFFLTDEALDYTLVAVAPTAAQGTPLSHFGWNRLIGTEGKILRGHPVNIVQHPEGYYKQITLSNNHVLQLVEHFFLYAADTLPGSSGSPVFNRQWEMVALHRRSVPRKVDGNIMTKGGQVWQKGISEDHIDWIGNEGTRISSLMRHLTAQPLSGRQDALRKELLERKAPQPFLVVSEALGRKPARLPAVHKRANVNGGNDGNGNISVITPAEGRAVTMPVQLTIALRVKLDVAGAGA
jgi:endonuclease G